MLDRFKRYLIEQGYSEYTPSGNPSTVYDYCKRINKICERENVTMTDLANKIDYYVDRYDTFGPETEFGKRSHNAFISSLKKFREFVQV